MGLWPRGLIGRVTLVLLGAIVVELLGTFILVSQAERVLLRSSEAHRVAEQLVVAERVLSRTPQAHWWEVAPSLSTRHVSFAIADAPPPVRGAGALSRAAADAVTEWEPSLRGRDLRIAVSGPGSAQPKRLVGALRTQSGRWIQFRSREAVTGWTPSWDWLFSLLFLVGAVLIVATYVVRTLAAPLRALSEAADRIGHSHRRVTVETHGPQELRRLARAFNEMQDRIAELVESRTRSLLAVSHDLRTPLARMRLRLGGREHPGDREAMADDVAEMGAMLDTLLDYLAGGDGSEPDPAQPTDIAALLRSLVTSMRRADAPIAIDAPDALEAIVRPVLLRRAVMNLIDNALKYGGDAEVRLTADDAMVHIMVRDHGPGIPTGLREKVVRPFYRVDEARARNTRGFGLGLAVAQRAATVHDGALSLEDAEPGLLVVLHLPIAGPDQRCEKESGNILIRF
nr:ATP-binding protein [Stakelama flava]